MLETEMLQTVLRCFIAAWLSGPSKVLWSGEQGGTRKLVRVEGQRTKHLVQSIQDLRLGWRLTFQQDSEAKHTAKSLRDNSVQVLKRFLQRPEHFCWSPSNLTERNISTSTHPAVTHIKPTRLEAPTEDPD